MKLMKNIFGVEDSMYVKIFSFEVLPALIMVVLAKLFSFVSDALFSKMGTTLDIQNLETLTVENFGPAASATTGWMKLFIASSFVFVLALIVSFAFFENKIWHTLVHKKTNKKNMIKFILFNVIDIIVLVLILAVVFLLVSRLPESSIQLGMILFYLLALFSIYLIYIGRLSFAKTGKIMTAVKDSFKIGIGKIDMTLPVIIFAIMLLPMGIIPSIIKIILLLVISLLFFAIYTITTKSGKVTEMRKFLINTMKKSTILVIAGVVLYELMSILSWNNTIMLVSQGIVMLAYLAWFKIMLAESLKSVKV